MKKAEPAPPALHLAAGADPGTPAPDSGGPGPDLFLSPPPASPPRGNIFTARVTPGRWYVGVADATHIVLCAEACPACDAPVWPALRRRRRTYYACPCEASFQGLDASYRQEELTHGLGEVPMMVSVSPDGHVLAFRGHSAVR